jgi:hypothetical protein
MKAFSTSDNQKTIELIVGEFKKLPDADRFPLPAVLYEKYGIEKPKHNNDDLNGAVANAMVRMNAGGPKVEIREAAPGGVREVQLPGILETETTLIPAPKTEDELNREYYTSYSKPTDTNTSYTPIQQLLRE